MKALDLFCGKGGWSEGFAKEGFECIGIDIINVGYPYKLLLQDVRTLNPLEFRDFDVIVGSPPCRDFSLFAKRFGSTWKKNPPNPHNGLKLVYAFINFVDVAKPKYWIMENVPGLCEYLPLKPRITKCLGSPEKQQMRRCFWGNFPNCFLPSDYSMKVKRLRKEVPRNYEIGVETNQAERAKIPVCFSKTIAHAIKNDMNILEVTEK